MAVLVFASTSRANTLIIARERKIVTWSKPDIDHVDLNDLVGR